MSPSGIDESWGYADPKQAYKAGVRVVSMYLSHDPSKNVTPAKVKAYHKAGIAVLLNWESQAGAPLKGAAQGNSDATAAVSQVKSLLNAVGYRPKNKLSITFSCDTDTNSSEYGRIDAYYANTKRIVHAAGFLNGVYGEASLVNHLHNAKLTDVEWQTYAWSGGVLSTQADYYQYLNGQHLAGASVDFDKVIHPDALGAWWPPGSAHDKPATGNQNLLELIMTLPGAPANLTYQKLMYDIQHHAGVAVLYNKKHNEDGKNAYIYQHIVDTHNRLRDTVMPVLAKLSAEVAKLAADVAALKKGS